MREKCEKLFEAIGGVADALIVDAAEHVFRRRRHWQRLAALAAVFALVIGLGVYGLSNIRMGSMSSDAPMSPEAPTEPSAPADPGSTGGGDEPESYMSYAGPVLPLTTLGAAPGLTAERHVNYDFSPYAPVQVDGYTVENDRSLVTDSYLLTNSTAEDMTVTLLYPFAANMFDSADTLPAISVDGVTAEAELCLGGYRAGFTGAEEGESYNLSHFNSWQDYSELLSDGSYLESALGSLPEPDTPVVVYEVTADEPAAELPLNTRLTLDFTLDYDAVELLSYGFNAASDDPDTGVCSRSANIGRAWGESAWLILLGGDLEEYSISCSAEAVESRVTRSETTLGAVLWSILQQDRAGYDAQYSDERMHSRISDEQFMAALLDVMFSFGPLSADPVQRYDEFGLGRLDDLFADLRSMQRVFYLSFELSIPAGGSVTLTAAMMKDASFDFIGEGEARNGYDLMTTAGSALEFTAQTASVSNFELIGILDQSFGFDLEGGLTEVTLDPAQEHYYMNIHRLDS